jgi:hypothetical protein
MMRWRRSLTLYPELSRDKTCSRLDTMNEVMNEGKGRRKGMKE